ncbi:MAG TPA: hypothetical protein VH678_30340 [Xanthobacteraceae bacterium]|jgi:hypothetical protein
MLHRSSYLVACCGAAFALASFLIGLEVSATTAASLPEQASAAINRSLKGDRLPLLPGLGRNAGSAPAEIKAPQAPPRTPELLVGCEPIVSSIGQPPLARVAGRCVS